MVNARVAHEYVEERIKGAVSIPYKEHSQTHIDFDPERDIFDLASGRIPEWKDQRFPLEQRVPRDTSVDGRPDRVDRAVGFRRHRSPQRRDQTDRGGRRHHADRVGIP
jgi:hypothetical protein